MLLVLSLLLEIPTTLTTRTTLTTPFILVVLLVIPQRGIAAPTANPFLLW